MKVDLSGTRDGADWPQRGQVADLPDVEALELVAAGMADVVRTEVVVTEYADAPATTRAATRR